MEENDFSIQVQQLVSQKVEWYNSEALQDLLVKYRLLHTCIKNLYEVLVKRSIIDSDPYRLDKRISEIKVPASDVFSESDISSIFGERFSDYENMLDYICTYMRFNVEELNMVTVKKLIDFNKAFEWTNISSNNPKMNTRALAICLANARNGAPSVLQSMINDSINKCQFTVDEIDKILNEYGLFWREYYKAQVRKMVFSNPGFDKNAAMSSAENEFNEIKKNFVKSLGKALPFYNDLISEIIDEDLGANKEKKREAVIKKLQPKVANVIRKKSEGPSAKEYLLATVLCLAGTAPTIGQLRAKLSENFNLLFEKKKNFLAKLFDALKKALNIREKEKIALVKIKDPKTGGERVEKLSVVSFMIDLGKKEKIYNGIAAKGPEYNKIESCNEDVILSFVNKQLSEIQSLFTMINALDAHFKNSVDASLKAKVKGMQIELSALRNSIVNTNKKRGEYISFKEESEQMKKLGISDE